MKNIFFLSILLFTLQLIFVANNPSFLKDLYSQVPWNRFPKVVYIGGENQRRVLSNIKKIHNNNKNKVVATYILGGSTAREFFHPDQELSKKIGSPIFNMAGSSQSLYDTLRIVDNIKTPGSTVIYMLYPLKFYHPEVLALEKADFLNGPYFLYPLESEALNSFFAKKKDLYEPKPEYTIFKPINVFSVTLRGFVQKVIDFADKIIKGERNLKQVAGKNNMNQYKYEESMTDAEFAEYAKSVRESFKNKKSLKSLSDQEAQQDLTEKMYNETLKFNAEILQLIYKTAKKRNLRFILMELPMAQRTEQYFGQEVQSFYNFKALNLANIDFFGFNKWGHKSPYFPDKYFNDTAHLLSVGRDYFSEYALLGLKHGQPD